MATRKKTRTEKTTRPPVSATPTICEATRGTAGRVIRGAEITEARAVARRQAGQDIVVCDGELRQNRALARRIENQVGPNQRDAPHDKAGPYALPHFHQVNRSPPGHSFYETPGHKAARNP
jgi:hypothetical protein